MISFSQHFWPAGWWLVVGHIAHTSGTENREGIVQLQHVQYAYFIRYPNSKPANSGHMLREAGVALLREQNRK